MALDPMSSTTTPSPPRTASSRLPLARMTGWDISPFDPDGLRVAPLRPPVLPEPTAARRGSRRLRHLPRPRRRDLVRRPLAAVPDHGRRRAAGPDAVSARPLRHGRPARRAGRRAGVLTTHIVRHIQALPHISRAHVYRIGDGGAHLHMWFFARPEGQAQLYGSWLVSGTTSCRSTRPTGRRRRRDRRRRAGRLLRRPSGGVATRVSIVDAVARVGR